MELNRGQRREVVDLQETTSPEVCVRLLVNAAVVEQYLSGCKGARRRVGVAKVDLDGLTGYYG